MVNEKRLIWDVDMKTAFREWFDHEDFRTMNQVIDDIPTVDAVEVVRCKDCVHYVNLLGNESDYRCSIFSGCYDRPYPTEADDFCSYGERREGE